MTSALCFVGICTKYIKKRRLVKAFQSLAGEDTELKEAHERFQKMVKLVQGVINNATLLGVHQIKDNMKNDRAITKRMDTNISSVMADTRKTQTIAQRMDGSINTVMAGTRRIEQYLENEESAAERHNILQFLGEFNFHDKQRDVHAKYQEGTGQWLLQGVTFQRWLNGEDTFTLWCPGIPGAGKTVMTAAAVAYTEAKVEKLNAAIVCLYCDYKTSAMNSDEVLLSSIVRQLAEQCRLIPEEVKTFWESFTTRRTHPKNNDRLSLIKTMSERFNRIYIFIDALDECQEKTRSRFLRMASELEPFARLFITSRPYIDLNDSFDKLCRLEIAANGSDIEVCLENMIEAEHKMRSHVKRDKQLRQDVIRTVVERANGMFLLAVLQMGHLCKQLTPKKVRQSMNTLSTSLDECYRTTIERIANRKNEDGPALARKALSYIFCAKRTLEVEELLHALSVEPGDTELDPMGCTDTEILLSVSEGLILVDERTGSTGLVHCTLQEYLEKHPEQLLPYPERDLATTCLTYLSSNDFANGPCVGADGLEARLNEFRFLDYASRHWGSHVLAAQLDEELDTVLDFLKDKGKLSCSVQVLYIPQIRTSVWYDCFPRQHEPLHAAAYWGLDKVLNLLWEEDKEMDINQQNSHGATALHLAAQNGNVSSVALLLEKGANVDTHNRRRETALILAGKYGHEAVVRLLLKNKADDLAEDDENWTALHWAIIGRHNDVAKLLLDCNDLTDREDVTQAYREEARQRSRKKALHLASEAGSNDAIQMLLDEGVDMEWQDEEGSPALHWTVPEGHESTVRLFIQRGVNVNSKDKYDNTPLHWSISYSAITRMLVENGANINAQNNEGRTPLHWSALEGQAEALEVLIQLRARVDLKDIYGMTALHAAALTGHSDMAQVLLKNGANPNEEDEDGWTPLVSAAVKQHYGLVSMLIPKIENGQQIFERVVAQLDHVNQRDILEELAEKKSVGSSVVKGLRMAVNFGYPERVNSLLEAGADIDAEDAIGGSTALGLAAWLCLEELFRLLLDKGADVNKRQRNGRTPLHTAAEDGYEGIVKMIIEHGADLDLRIHGWTAMLLAAKNWFPSIVTRLVNSGADVNAADYHGRRALHWAGKTGGANGEGLARLLLAKGAELDATDHWGWSPLFWAVQNANLELVVLLLDFGADIGLVTKTGFTVLHLAAYVGDVPILQQLLNRGVSVNARTPDGPTALDIASFFNKQTIIRLLKDIGAVEEEEMEWEEDDDGSDAGRAVQWDSKSEEIKEEDDDDDEIDSDEPNVHDDFKHESISVSGSDDDSDGYDGFGRDGAAKFSAKRLRQMFRHKEH
ncbi:ankyrin repeat-containing domain protein [Pseudomassariella vexata]|uniref:Ankyrin repeat-containing domain protein n=1 Tax=Pseudomassariella vexata TaxID=1141098 RepID=A0A1Y2DR67_9PEZI|nr:ankyrin repeat-containing domain protein [Pseudomassariella vexata]ORY61624.1 ankyrin repeat-containing domain protein [Pseudomassariella vexata]